MELVKPHGGKLVNLLVNGEQAEALKKETLNLPSWDLTDRQVCDLEMLMNGGFSPLTGFLNKDDYESVCEKMRLADGTLWPIPITLDVSENLAESLSPGNRVALRHPEGMVLAILTVGDVWKADLQKEAQDVFGTMDDAHPTVFHLLHKSNPFYVGGSLEGLEPPPHHTFKPLRHTPAELRRQFSKLSWNKIVAFQTRRPMHRAQVELTRRAAARTNANILIHPVVGLANPGDVDYFVRVRCYQAVLKHYPEQTTMLSLLPIAMRLAGPREAIWHAIIRKNHGCSHFVVGCDHAGPGKDREGKDIYAPYAARDLAKQYEDELGIRIVDFEEMEYVEDLAQYKARSEVPENSKPLSLSSTELRRRLRAGLEIPEWFSYPEVITELRRSYPPRSKQGFTVFFTGLSGSGKSTLANVLLARLMEMGDRPVTLLDGDIVRKNLSSELGFSKEHRDLNIHRIGFVANEITKNRGVAICAPIAPYESVRREVRDLISESGGFILVYVSTPLEVCEKRDRKGLYAKARAGIIKEFTGISDPYEDPIKPEIVIDTSKVTTDEAVQEIILHLESEGFIG